MAGGGAQASIPEAARGSRILIVEARFYDRLADMLLEGARAMLERAACTVDVVTVPGSLEVPPAIALALGRYDGFVALGCVIRGETTHYDLVAGESCRGIMDLGLRERAPIGNGILTVENEEQALVRADPHGQDKGGGAALAALTLIGIRKRLAG